MNITTLRQHLIQQHDGVTRAVNNVLTALLQHNERLFNLHLNDAKYELMQGPTALQMIGDFLINIARAQKEISKIQDSHRDDLSTWGELIPESEESDE